MRWRDGLEDDENRHQIVEKMQKVGFTSATGKFEEKFNVYLSFVCFVCIKV